MPVALGANSRYVVNAKTSPAKIITLEKQGTPPVEITFDVVAREGAFTDTTTANYSLHGQNATLNRWLRSELSKHSPNFIKGELTTRFESVSPKNLSFEIILREDANLPAALIIVKVSQLQSLCYPRFVIGGNPPLCRLIVLNLYDLECYVQQVAVTWHSTWDIEAGLPFGCNIELQVMMHQYPTREEVLRGGSFRTQALQGYAGTPGAAGAGQGTPMPSTPQVPQSNI